MNRRFLSYLAKKSANQILFIVLLLESLAIVLAISSAIAVGHAPKAYFEEGGYMSILSCFQLLGGALLARKIFLTAKESSNHLLNKSSFLWRTISFGLFFLTLDDAFQIHENIDKLLHLIFDFLFDFKETNVSDLADDLIVGLYLLAFLVYIARKWQIVQIFRNSFIYFKIGFILTGMMVFFDTISNNRLFVSMLLENIEQQKFWQVWIGTLEDSIKIYAEGLFIVGIYKCWRIAKSPSKRLQ